MKLQSYLRNCSQFDSIVAQHQRYLHSMSRERQVPVARADAVPPPVRNCSRPVCALRDRIGSTSRHISFPLHSGFLLHCSVVRQLYSHAELSFPVLCASCSPYGLSEKRTTIDFGAVELSAMGDPARIPTLYLTVSNESSIDTWLTFAADLFATRATRVSVVKKFVFRSVPFFLSRARFTTLQRKLCKCRAYILKCTP